MDLGIPTKEAEGVRAFQVDLYEICPGFRRELTMSVCVCGCTYVNYKLAGNASENGVRAVGSGLIRGMGFINSWKD